MASNSKKQDYRLSTEVVDTGVVAEQSALLPDPAVEIKRVSTDLSGDVSPPQAPEGGVVVGKGGKVVGGASGPGYNFTGVSPGKVYLHPPTALIEGCVVYNCKYLGHLKVPEPRGSQLVQDAIDKLLAVASVNKINFDKDPPEVELLISIKSLMTVDKSSKKAYHQHSLPLISFSADDKRKKSGNIFAYVSKGKPPATDHVCYVYQCSSSQAPEITTTVGQAFDLAYLKSQEAKQAQEKQGQSSNTNTDS